MDQMRLPLHADESAPNVFDMDLECEQAHEAAKAPAPAPAGPTVAPAADKTFRMRPAYFILASALVAVVWIGWPALSAPADKGTSQVRQIPAADAPSSVSAQAAPIPASEVPAPIASQPGPPDVAVPPLAVTVGAQILREQANQATAMIKAIDSMAVRLADLEAKVLAMSQPRQLGVAASIVVPAKPAVGRQRPQQALTGTASVEQLASPAYQLNTIFRDQAWIAYADSIHVVQAGDRLGELTIVRVDAAAHRVLTTAGVIR